MKNLDKPENPEDSMTLEEHYALAKKQEKEEKEHQEKEAKAKAEKEK